MNAPFDPFQFARPASATAASVDPVFAILDRMKTAKQAMLATRSALHAIEHQFGSGLPAEDHPLYTAHEAAQDAFSAACNAQWDVWADAAEVQATTLPGAVAKAQALQAFIRHNNEDDRARFDPADLTDDFERLAWSLAADLERLAGASA